MVTTTQAPTRGPVRRASSFLFAHPRLKLTATIGAPLAWIVIVYLSAIVFMLLTSLWHVDPLTTKTVREVSLDNYRTVYLEHTYRAIALRTVGVAAAVTIADRCSPSRWPTSWRASPRREAARR